MIPLDQNQHYNQCNRPDTSVQLNRWILSVPLLLWAMLVVGILFWSVIDLFGSERDMTTSRPGRYRHYKGNKYIVLGVPLHSETHEELVVYRPEYGDHGLWVRPLAMSLEMITVDGQEMA